MKSDIRKQSEKSFSISWSAFWDKKRIGKVGGKQVNQFHFFVDKSGKKQTEKNG